MLTDDEIRRIIREYLEKGQIDTGFFVSSGIDLDLAIETDFVSLVSDEAYEVTSYGAIKKYAKDMAAEHNFSQAVKAYKECLKQNPSDTNVAEELFYNLVKIGDFEEAYNAFGSVLELDSQIYHNDGPLFMLLFSRIIEIPEEDRAFLDCLSESDFLLPDDDPRHKWVFAINNARKKTFLGNESVALMILDAQFKTYKNSLPKDLYVYWHLERKALDLDIDMQMRVSDLAREGKYAEAYNIYSKKAEKTPLKYRDEVVMHLLETMTYISEGLTVTNNDLFTSAQTFELILKDNFLLAREENRKRAYNGKKNNLITSLLDKVCMGLTPAKDVEVSIDDLEYYLVLNDYPNFFMTLNNYLKKIGKKEYFAYVTMLIALDGLTHGSKAIDFLIDGEFNKFDVRGFEQAFERDFKDRKYANCLVYYYLLKELRDLGIDNTVDIAYYEEKISHKKWGLTGSEDALLVEIEEASKVPVAHIPVPEEEKKYSGENGKLLRKIDEVKSKKNFKVYTTDKLEEYRFLVDTAESDEHIRVSSIKDEQGFTIFIKYVSDKNLDESADYIIKGDEAYLSGNIREALKNYRKALSGQKTLDLNLLKKMTLCYISLNDFKKAIFYMNVCAKLEIIRGLTDKDPASALLQISSDNITSEDLEKLTDYYEETCDFASIYERIAYLVTEEGLTFEEATSRYKLPLESILDLKLYYAEYAFVLGYEDVAMRYINELVNSPSVYHKGAALDLLARKDELKGSREVSEVLAKYLRK